MSRRIVPLLPPSLSTTPRGAYYLTDAQIALIGNDLRETSGGRVYAKARASLLPQDRRQGTRDLSSNRIIDLDPNDWIYLVKENGKWRTASNLHIPDLKNLWLDYAPNEATLVNSEGKVELAESNELPGVTVMGKSNLPLSEIDAMWKAMYGDEEGSSGTGGFGRVYSVYDQFNPTSQAIWNYLNQRDLNHMKGIANPLKNGWNSTWNVGDFMNTVLPLKQLSPTHIAGAMMLDKEGFLSNYLWGENLGLAELNQTTRDLAAAYPYLNAGINMLGDAATFKFLPRIPRLMPKLGRAGLAGRVGSVGNTALESLGNWSNAGELFASRITSSALNTAKNSVRNLPGGSYASLAGRYAFLAGSAVKGYANRALNTLKDYGNRALQLVPDNVKTTVSDAYGTVSPYLLYFNPSHAIGKGFEWVTGQTLTPTAQTGLKAGWSIGSTIWDLTSNYLNGEDVDYTKTGKFLKYVPFANSLNRLYSWYDKGKKVDNLVDNAIDMVNNGVNADNVYDAGNNIVTILDNNNNKEDETKINLPQL